MIRAVICDDERATCNIIRHFTEAEKLPLQIVGTAENGRDALELIRREKPDLVFMDIHMPYMNGFEIIQQIQACRIIIITAYDSLNMPRELCVWERVISLRNPLNSGSSGRR